MSVINKVLITGVIGDNPRITYLQQEEIVVNFILKNSYAKKNKDESLQTVVQFFNCSAYSRFINNLAKLVVPGNKVLVVGSLKQGSYKDKDGNYKNSVSITADSITVFGNKERNEEYE